MKKQILFILAALLLSWSANAQMTNIPDANFLQALKDLEHGIGAVGNNIPTANLKTITELNVSNKTISDLTGIQDFTALKKLVCDGNNLIDLDVSKNIALSYLDCEQNQIKSLDVTKNIALTFLNCGDNAITILNLSKNTALEYLTCYENQLLSIDMRNGYNANMIDFDAKTNPNLSCIYVNDKNIHHLSYWNKDETAKFANNESECSPPVAYTHIPDANFLQALKDLGRGTGAVGNDIPTANLSTITILEVNNKNISDLTGIQDFVALTSLNCRTNKLTSLDVSRNTALTYLTCEFNDLEFLNLSKNTKLTDLYCNYNKLKVLDVSNNAFLNNLSCLGNNLSVLDVSKNTKLTYLNCSSNHLTSLDMRNGNNVNVTDFYAHNNPNLSCIYVNDKNGSYLSGWRKDETAKFANNESECSPPVAYTHIPDANFLQALKDLGYGTGAVGNDIPTANLSTITELEVSSKNISDLTGIQDFVALTQLRCIDRDRCRAKKHILHA